MYMEKMWMGSIWIFKW